MQLSKLLYKNIFWRGINMGSVFVLNILISQVYGAEQYGQLFSIVNTLSFAVLLLSLSIDAGLTYYNSKNELDSAGVVSFAFLWAIMAAIIATILFTLLNKINHQQVLLSNAFMYIMGMLLLAFFSALFIAKHHYIVQNLSIAIANVVLGLLVYFFNYSFQNFNTLFFVMVLAQGIAMGIGYTLLYNPTWQINLLNKVSFQKIIKYSIVAFAANVTFFLVYRVDYWIIDHLVKDKQQLGNYIQVAKVAQLFFIIPSIVASTIFAVTAEGKREDIEKKIIKLSGMLFLITLVLCLPLIIFGSVIFPWVFGDTFIYMYKPFLFLVPGILILPIQAPFGAYNGGLNNMKYNLIATFAALSIIVVGDFIFVPNGGIKAAAMVSSIAYCICTLILISIFIKNKILKRC
jgi:O-antigen/teichoic acid export membrane protein